MWQHIAMTYGQPSGTLNIYLDGNLVGTTNFPGNPVILTTNDLIFGYRPDGAASPSFLNGQLDEMSLYNRVLSSTELQSIFAAGIAGKVRPAGPTLLTQPQSLTVDQGTPATFSVAATGFAPLAYQWRFNGTNLPGQTNLSLTFPSAASAQEGAYDVRVTQLDGVSALSTPATLNVLAQGEARMLFAVTNDVSNFRRVAGGAVTWLLTPTNTLLVVPGSGSIQSTQNFGDFVLHAEFRCPSPTDAANGNSGIYLQNRYEVQIFNSFGVAVPGGNDVGAIWNQRPPSTNAALPAGQWQTYDITFHQAQWNGNTKVAPARVTVVLNGLTVQNNVALTGPTTGGAAEGPTPGPVVLQDNGSAVQFRNVRITPLDMPPEFKWAQRAGSPSANGSNGDFGKGVTRDAQGNVFIVGQYLGTATFGPTNITATGAAKDMFLAKYDAGGNFQWVRSFGGTGDDEAYAVKVDALGNLYVSGRYDASDTLGLPNLVNTGGHDAFLAKFDPQGTLLWWRQAGAIGAAFEYALGLALDSQGNPIIAGGVENTANFGGTPVSTAGGSDAYVAKYDPAGTVLWVRALGIAGGGRANGVACDSADNVLVTGQFSTSILSNGVPVAASGGTDGFVAKYDRNGLQLWVEVAGGGGNDAGEDVASDAQGNVIVTGTFRVIAAFGTNTLTSAGQADVFTAKYDANGNLLWVRQGGGSGVEDVFQGDLATDGLGNIYVTGAYQNTATFSATGVASAGDNDVFVTKYAPDGTQIWVQRFGDVGYDHARGIVADGNGEVYLTGAFNGTVNFGATQLISAGGNDIFITRLGQTPPVLTQQPLGGTVLAGQNLTLTVGATGTGGLAYQWRLNGTNLVGATNASYVLAPATATAGGTYDVVVTHAFGFTVSSPAVVTVVPTASPLPLEWAIRAGGAGGDGITALELDGQGDVIVAGAFNGVATFGTNGLSTVDADAGYVAKLDPQGNFRWVTQLGAGTNNADTRAYATAVDRAGNVYVGGYFQQLTTLGTNTLTTFQAGGDGFLAKLDPNGNVLWARQVSSGVSGFIVEAVATDPLGNVFVAGAGHLEKVASDGTTLWTKPLGFTVGSLTLSSIKVDGVGEVYAAGSFSRTLTLGTNNLNSAGGTDVYVTKLDANGNYLWATRGGGLQDDFATSLVLTPAGLAVGGNFGGSSGGPATFGFTTLTSYGKEDGFIAKLNFTGTFLWARAVGGLFADNVQALATDSEGSIYASGRFANSGTFGNVTLTAVNTGLFSWDPFVTKLDGSGNFLWAQLSGGDYGDGLAVDASQAIYLAGTFSGTGSQGRGSVAFGTNILVGAGGSDVFISKFAVAPPTISNQPASQTVPVTQPVSFTVGASGVQPFVYQWFFNGTPIPGAVGATYTILSATPTNVGNYSVRISDPFGFTVSSNATLAVDTSGVPFIYGQPLTQTVPQGTPVLLTVGVSGGQPLSYQWRRSNTNLAGENFPFLALNGTTTNTSGSYSVVVTNSFGAITSAPAVVTITPVFPPVITASPQSLTVLAGSNVTFSVTASGTPPFNYQWVRGGVGLPGNDAPTLTVTNATLADAGNYFVQVFNSAGLASSATATLTVQAPPAFLSVPTDLVVLQGATTNFSTSFSGVPTPALAWFKDGVRLTNSAGYSGVSTPNLLVLTAQGAQVGSYVVVATNVAGAITSAPVTLTVLLAPVITAHPTNVTLTRTDYAGNVPATLNVAATGAAPLLYQWRFNGGDLPGETNAALVLTNVTRLNNGLYQAVVANVAGTATSSNALVRVRVAQRVEPPVFTPGQPFRLRFTDDNGEQPSAVDLAKLEVQAAASLRGTNTVWVTLTNAFTVVNGVIEFADPASTNLLRRYYRVIER